MRFIAERQPDHETNRSDRENDEYNAPETDEFPPSAASLWSGVLAVSSRVGEFFAVRAFDVVVRVGRWFGARERGWVWREETEKVASAAGVAQWDVGRDGVGFLVNYAEARGRCVV